VPGVKKILQRTKGNLNKKASRSQDRRRQNYCRKIVIQECVLEKNKGRKHSRNQKGY